MIVSHCMTRSRVPAMLAAAVIGVLALSQAGCKSEKESVRLAPEPGSYVRQFQERQMSKADADAFVIYRNEWSYDEPDQLSPFGKRHVSKLTRRAVVWPYPVIIEPTESDPELDELRRQVVVQALEDADVPNADLRVTVDAPRNVTHTYQTYLE